MKNNLYVIEGALNTDLSRLYSTMAPEFALTDAGLKFIKCRPSIVLTRDNPRLDYH